MLHVFVKKYFILTLQLRNGGFGNHRFAISDRAATIKVMKFFAINKQLASYTSSLSALSIEDM